MSSWTRGAIAAGAALSLLLVLLPGHTKSVGAQELITFCFVDGGERQTITLLDKLALDDEGALLTEYGLDSSLGPCERDGVDTLPSDFTIDIYSGEIIPKAGGAFANGVIYDQEEEDETGQTFEN